MTPPLTPRTIARALRTKVRAVRYRTVASTLIHEKRSPGDPLAPVREAIKGLPGRTLLPELAPAMARKDHLHALLSGQIRETSYRHQIQKMDAGEVLAGVSSPPTALNLIHLTARAAAPGWRVELGAAFGIGTLALCLAERDTNNPVDGIEFEPWRAEIAQEGARAILADRVSVHPGRIEDVLPALAPHRPKVAFAFVDAMHTFEATVGYHDLLAAHAAPGALVLYDDLPWSEGMERAWKHIVADPRVTDAIRIDRRWGLTRYQG